MRALQAEARSLSVDNPPKPGSSGFMKNTIFWPVPPIMKLFTGGDRTHACWCGPRDRWPDENELMVWEAVPWHGVRMMTWEKYVTEILPLWEKLWIGPLDLLWWEPKEEFPQSRMEAMLAEARRLEGKKYSMIVRYFLPAIVPNRIHCSETVSRIYEAGGVIESHYHKDDPDDVLDKLLNSNW